MSLFVGRSENAVNAIWRLLVRLAVIAGIAYACYRLRSLFTTLFVAAIIAYVLDPIVEWLCRSTGFLEFHAAIARLCVPVQTWYRAAILRKSSPAPVRVRLRRHSVRLFAVFYVFILAVLVFWQGTKLVVTPFVAEFRDATSAQGQQHIRENREKFFAWYNKTVPDWAQSDKIKQQILNSNAAGAMQKAVADFGLRVVESMKYVVELVLLPVLAFYFLIDGRKLKHEFVSLVPRSRMKETLRILYEFNLIMRAFVAGQFILCALAGVVVGVGLAALGVKYPMILGVLAGITRAIPIIGPIIGGIPIILLTLATKGMTVALGVLGFFTFLHFAESKFIMPKLIGDRMELHPVVIIVVLIMGGELGGVLIGGQLGALLGMFFAAPIAAIVRVLVRRYWLHLRPNSRRTPRALLPSGSVETVGIGLAETLE